MIYVVEIRVPGGGKASKEYEAVSLRAAIRLVDLEFTTLSELRNHQHTGARRVGDMPGQWRRLVRL